MSAATPDSASPLTQRVDELVAAFTRIAGTRMAGVPVLNAALQVEAIGFEPEGRGEACVGVGILITPWFMNLVRLPLARRDGAHAVGLKQRHAWGEHVFEFIGAHEDAVGRFEACSLFSPMFEFPDPAAARSTAHAVLCRLRQTAVRTPPAAPSADAGTAPARRAFLFGRRGNEAVRP